MGDKLAFVEFKMHKDNNLRRVAVSLSSDMSIIVAKRFYADPGRQPFEILGKIPLKEAYTVQVGLLALVTVGKESDAIAIWNKVMAGLGHVVREVEVPDEDVLDKQERQQSGETTPLDYEKRAKQLLGEDEE